MRSFVGVFKLSFSSYLVIVADVHGRTQYYMQRERETERERRGNEYVRPNGPGGDVQRTIPSDHSATSQNLA
jgi:hypothetical protein